MRSLQTILLFCFGIAMLASASRAEVLQSSGQGGSLWTQRDGAEIRDGRVGKGEIRAQLPPGATLRDLEPTTDGWLAAGRFPMSEGTELLIVAGDEGGADLLPVPQRGPGRYRGQPVLLLERQELVGLAWAEGNGPREMEIWAAPWQDGEWGRSELVSAKGPGSQVAPVGVVLGDGSWMLLWAAHDGEDDEIVASRRVGAIWTQPERIHSANEVPDATPDILPINGGALAVWSWFDGNDYRLKSARWIGGSWHESEAFGGKGSGEPVLLETEKAIHLLYPSVEPPTWTVLELDRAGNEQRVAVVSKTTHEQPLLLLDEEGGDRLRWATVDRPLEWRDLP